MAKQNKSVLVSVIICTHNPRPEYLRRTLDALRAQTLPKDEWELLLIDNASAEPLAGQWDLSWHPQARHVREEVLGITPARLRGIAESTAEILLFVDDDNVLAPDYAERLLRLAAEHPRLGCFGAGRLEPEFEVEPAPELRPYLGMLALRTVNQDHWSNNPSDPIIPWGAGLAVRRSVGQEYRKCVEDCSLRRDLDRKGKTLNSGGDDEFSWVACQLGLGKGLFPELRLTHLIDRRRLDLDYLLRLAEGHAFSQAVLSSLHRPDPCLLATQPSFGAVLRAALCLSVSQFFFEGQRWWSYRSKSELGKAFDAAWHRGTRRALELLNSSGTQAAEP